MKKLAMGLGLAAIIGGLSMPAYADAALEKKAKQGDLMSQIELAGNYVHGRNGYPENREKALTWTRKMCENKQLVPNKLKDLLADACFSAVVGYAQGEDIKKDGKVAINLLIRSCKLGNEKACYLLIQSND